MPEAATAAAPSNQYAPWGGRWFSLLEFVVGGAIVVGHNVFHKVPNEVPILVVLGLLSFAIRERSFRPMGFSMPSFWKKTILIAIAAAVIRILVGQLVIDPTTAHFWPAAKAAKGMNEIAGNWKVALQWLALIWTFAAFGEEISYRGYLMNRAADLGARSKLAYAFAIPAMAVLFGYGHYYKGPAGIIDSGFAGVVLGITFLVSGRNLWACILAHGLIDTVAVVCLFMGWVT
jgi:hypothetical protein